MKKFETTYSPNLFRPLRGCFGVCPFDCIFNLDDNIYLFKESKKLDSYCKQTELFNYHGIENALIGETNNLNNKFTPRRITVIQMI